MSARPVASEEENKKLVHAWAHQLRRELAKDHPAQSTLTAVIRHNYVPTFAVAKPLEQAEEAANLDKAGFIEDFVEGFGNFSRAISGGWGVIHQQNSYANPGACHA